MRYRDHIGIFVASALTALSLDLVYPTKKVVNCQEIYTISGNVAEDRYASFKKIEQEYTDKIIPAISLGLSREIITTLIGNSFLRTLTEITQDTKTKKIVYNIRENITEECFRNQILDYYKSKLEKAIEEAPIDKKEGLERILGEIKIETSGKK